MSVAHANKFALSKLCLNGGFAKIFRRSYTIQPPPWLRGNTLNVQKDKYDFPDHTETFEERMKKFKEDVSKDVDNGVFTPKNIGADLPMNKTQTNEEIFQSSETNRLNKKFEKAARQMKLNVPLDEVRKDWMAEHGPNVIKALADHYGIYKDLFGGDFFYPTVGVDIFYDVQDGFLIPVCRGNVISPEEASKPPVVEITSQPDQLWTLIMVNPDENLTNQDGEYIHWLVANIPGDDISKGEVVMDYFQPIPAAGTGFHRNVFILFEQKGKINYDEIKRTKSDAKLDDRHFKTQRFFINHKSELVPRGLAFFQSQWDESVRHYFRHVLGMAEPSFEYDHPTPYHPPVKKFPHREPFNLYLDRYRDRKDIDEEVLRMKLKNTSAFKPRESAFKYPLVHLHKRDKPSWLRMKEELMIRRVEQYKELD